MALENVELEVVSKSFAQEYSTVQIFQDNIASEILHLKKIVGSTFHSERELVPLTLLI